MTSPKSLKEAELIGKGSQSEVYTWGDGQVLKLFRPGRTSNMKEMAVASAAHKAGVPGPEVIDGLIEVDDREGIVFERIDGLTLFEYLKDNPNPSELATCAKQTAELLARIHSARDPALRPVREDLIRTIKRADCLDAEMRRAVLHIIDELPMDDTLCHGDFFPDNIIVSKREVMVIDWGSGGTENPLYDFARFKVRLMHLQDRLRESHTSESTQRRAAFLRSFVDVFCQRYEELRPIDKGSFACWQMVASAVRASQAPREKSHFVSLIRAVLDGTEHRYL